MKTTFKIVTVIVMLSYSCSVRQGQYDYGQKYRDEGQYSINYQTFYNHLDPYGYWVDYPEYGYIWIPDSGPDFFPYVTNGQWVYSEYGWTWLSDYEWGWAPFHYGRWNYDNYYGWFWVPGDEWGPAWVTWRRANGYYGWAPMRPGINVRMGMLGGSRDVEMWSFVRERDFGKPDIHRRHINRRNNESIFRNSTIINNTYIDNSRNVTYMSGPRPEDVGKVTGRRVNQVTINDYDRPGSGISNSGMIIYRPQVQGNTDSRAAPPRVTDPGEVKAATERNPAGTRRNIEVQGSRGQESRRQQIESQTQRQMEQQDQPARKESQNSRRDDTSKDDNLSRKRR